MLPQQYVYESRKSHYLEGALGEYIVPNWKIYTRESLLYADIFTYEDGAPSWNEPQCNSSCFDFGHPIIWQLCAALQNFGIFSRSGLNVVAEVWGKTDFVDKQGFSEARNLTEEMLMKLHSANLINDDAKQEELRYIYNGWQIPMYRIELTPIRMSLDELKRQRDANLWAEMDY